jgi:hypothetical protein
MPATKKTYGFLKFLLLVTLIVVLKPGAMAQVSGSANIRAAIVSSDELTDLSLTSSDGTEFLLQNDMNRCYDVSITGMSPTLKSENQKQDLNYELSPRQIQPTSFCNSNTKIKVLLNDLAAVSSPQSMVPYTIMVHYN